MMETFPVETLKRIKLKVTKTRVQVLKILKESAKPLTHADIMDQLDSSHSWDKVTIYRTLGELEHKNIIKSFLNKERITFFEYFDLNQEHGHLSCESCGRLECLDSSNFELQWKKTPNFQIQSIEIIVRGFCKDCR